MKGIKRFMSEFLGANTTNNSSSSSFNVQPLNTLLELLTGKISLNEIDFNLLIESTQATLECNEN
jgi:hypothetical protein